MDMVLEEYKEVTDYKKSNLNPTLSAVLSLEVNEKIKKNLYEVISVKSQNPVVKDLIAHIKIFTDNLSENSCLWPKNNGEKWSKQNTVEILPCASLTLKERIELGRKDEKSEFQVFEGFSNYLKAVSK